MKNTSEISLKELEEQTHKLSIKNKTKDKTESKTKNITKNLDIDTDSNKSNINYKNISNHSDVDTKSINTINTFTSENSMNTLESTNTFNSNNTKDSKNKKKCHKNRIPNKIECSLNFLLMYIGQCKITKKDSSCTICTNIPYAENTETKKNNNNQQNDMVASLFNQNNVVEIAIIYCKSLRCLLKHRHPLYIQSINIFQNLLFLELYLTSHYRFSSNVKFHIKNRSGLGHDINFILNSRRYETQKKNFKLTFEKLDLIGKKYRIDEKLHIHRNHPIESLIYQLMRYNCIINSNDTFIKGLSILEINAVFYILYARKEHFRFQRLYNFRKNEFGLRLNLLLSLEGRRERDKKEIMYDYDKKNFLNENEKMIKEITSKITSSDKKTLDLLQNIYREVGIIITHPNKSNNDNQIDNIYNIQEIVPLSTWFKIRGRRFSWISFINKWRENRGFAYDITMIHHCISSQHYREGLLIFENLQILEKMQREDENLVYDEEFDINLTKKAILYALECAVEGFIQYLSNLIHIKNNTKTNVTNKINNIYSNNYEDVGYTDIQRNCYCTVSNLNLTNTNSCNTDNLNATNINFNDINTMKENCYYKFFINTLNKLQQKEIINFFRKSGHIINTESLAKGMNSDLTKSNTDLTKNMSKKLTKVKEDDSNLENIVILIIEKIFPKLISLNNILFEDYIKNIYNLIQIYKFNTKDKIVNVYLRGMYMLNDEINKNIVLSQNSNLNKSHINKLNTTNTIKDNLESTTINSSNTFNTSNLDNIINLDSSYYEDNLKKLSLINNFSISIYRSWILHKKTQKSFIDSFLGSKIRSNSGNIHDIEEIYENILLLQTNYNTIIKFNQNNPNKSLDTNINSIGFSNLENIRCICKDLTNSNLDVDHNIISVLREYHDNIIKCSCNLLKRETAMSKLNNSDLSIANNKSMDSIRGRRKILKYATKHFCEL